jgi:hypothetical protein
MYEKLAKWTGNAMWWGMLTHSLRRTWTAGFVDAEADPLLALD